MKLTAFCLILAVLLSSIGHAGTPAAWQPLPEADMAALSPDDFADEELFAGPNFLHTADRHGLDAHFETGMPYYLAHFHRVAEAVRPEPPNRGFLDIRVWRAPQYNRPYNARIMESCLSLIWFYTADRKWNPYRGHPAVRQRLEAALEYWVNMQHDDGRFSEYGDERWNLAATAFATKFMGEGLLLLADGPPIDKALHRRVTAAQRKAILATLTRGDFWDHGSRFTNQYGNVWAGAPAYLLLYPDDEEVRGHFLRRFAESEEVFQSPAGYFHESLGPDWSYNFGTHHSNTRMAWHLARQLNLDEAVRQLEREHALWAEWLSYNAVPEPDGSGFTLNRAIETRQSLAHFRQLDTPLAEPVAAARAFATSREEYEQTLKLARDRTEATWPAVPALRVGEHMGYSPYAFLHLRHPNYYPTEAEREAARRQLPYLARERFVHQRADDRTTLAVTCVRRPSYYAVFNAGPGRGGHRYGLGLLWHPRAGTFLQQQTTRLSAPGWGTRTADVDLFESAAMAPEYEMDGEPFDAKPGNRDVEGRNLAIRYPLRKTGRKTVTFLDDRIEVRVELPGAFSENVPVLGYPGDEVVPAGRRVTVARHGVVLEIVFDDAAEVEYARLPGGRDSPAPHCHFIAIKARDQLQYTIRFSDMAASPFPP